MLSHVEIIVQKLFIHFMVSKSLKNRLRRWSNAKVVLTSCYFQWLRLPKTFETMSNSTLDLKATSDSSEIVIGWRNNRALLRHHFGDILPENRAEKG